MSTLERMIVHGIWRVPPTFRYPRAGDLARAAGSGGVPAPPVFTHPAIHINTSPGGELVMDGATTTPRKPACPYCGRACDYVGITHVECPCGGLRPAVNTGTLYRWVGGGVSGVWITSGCASPPRPSGGIPQSVVERVADRIQARETLHVAWLGDGDPWGVGPTHDLAIDDLRRKAGAK